ncbi:MAG: lipid-A-disaccharide synthase [Planctomycetes bacterium]|nr:lipid-A-disaccharide synthase [Planctomycetota bacterium]
MPPRVFLSAGEPSGDHHAAALLREARALAPGLEAWALGGPRLAAQGARLIHDTVSEGLIGFVDVLRNLGHLRELMGRALEHLRRERPDVLVCVDYPGWNLRLAARARGLGVPVLWYVSPQVWAWRGSRIGRVSAVVDRMMCLFEFERPLYEARGVPVDVVGHPLFDHLAALSLDEGFARRVNPDGLPAVGLLPGSRPREVQANLPLMLRTAALVARRTRARFVLGLASEAHLGLVEAARRAVPEAPPVEAAPGQAYEVMASSRVALVASGTAGLELACLGTPPVVCYRVGAVARALAPLLLTTPHISLVNIVAGRRVVPEHLSWRDCSRAMADDVLRLLPEGPERSRTVRDLAEVRSRLGGPGASARAARILLEVAGTAGAWP